VLKHLCLCKSFDVRTYSLTFSVCLHSTSTEGALLVNLLRLIGLLPLGWFISQ